MATRTAALTAQKFISISAPATAHEQPAQQQQGHHTIFFDGVQQQQARRAADPIRDQQQAMHNDFRLIIKPYR